jgi:hypothetical protein
MTNINNNNNNNSNSNNSNGEIYYRNPEMEDDLMEDNRNSKGLKNLRKFKY